MRPLRLPSIRGTLIQANLDIDALYEYVRTYGHREVSDLHTIVLLLEDRRFRAHYGIDYLSFIRDLWRKFTFRSHGGFSTIEMQFVRTVTARYERTVSRKLYECMLAHLCNWHFQKDEILTTYVSIAYYGTMYPVLDTYGLYNNPENVASDIFDRSLSHISLEEAAEIASYLVYPRPVVINKRWLDRVERRKRYGLRLFAKRKKILK